MIQENILELVKYGLSTGLVDPEDKVYTINRLLELFQVDEIEDAVFEKVENLPAWTQEEAEGKLEGILAEMMDYAYENGLMAENSIVYKDLFDTKIMGCLVPEPSSVRKTFRDLYEHTSPLAAMAFGSFSGLDRLMVISSVPNSVSVVHLRSFLIRCLLI